MGFGSDSISVITGGLRFATGTFPERLVSHGLVGNIGAAVSRIIRAVVRAVTRTVAYIPTNYPTQ